MYDLLYIDGGELDKFLCELNDLERRRVCNQALCSSHFNKRIIYLGREEQVERGHCRIKKISFKSDNAQAETAGKNFHEWMIGCNASVYNRSENSDASWYYISRAYGAPDEVFVFHGGEIDSDLPVVFENRSSNVRFHIPGTE